MSHDEEILFAVSSTAFRRKPLEDVIHLAEQNRLALEFSSGIPYREDVVQLFLGAPIQKYLHNYFPAPRDPFVLNLASCDNAILQRSIQHCEQGLLLAKQSGGNVFSVHAGFCLDPDPKSLGKKLELKNNKPRSEHWDRFIKAVKQLCEKAEQLGVRLLIENNVLAKMNLLPGGQSSLLCCDADEVLKLFEQVSHPSLGFLLDTGHWKVSANTLGFELNEILKVVDKIEGVHHSDNDGFGDTNEPILTHYWFLPYMSKVKASVLHVLEVHDQSLEDIARQKNLLGKGS